MTDIKSPTTPPGSVLDPFRPPSPCGIDKFPYPPDQPDDANMEDVFADFIDDVITPTTCEARTLGLDGDVTAL